MLLAPLSGCGPPPEQRAGQLAREIRQRIRTGDLNRAAALASRAWEQWRRHPGSEAHWDLRLLYAQVLALQGKVREMLPLVSEEPPGGERFLALRARRLMCLGRARFIEADYPESRRLLNEALLLASAASDPLLEAEIQLWLASALARSGEFHLADQACRASLNLAAQHGDLYLQTAAYGNRGFIRLNSGRFDEAIPFFEQALRLAQQAGARRFVANTLGNLGRCYAGLGDDERATPLLSEAAATIGELGEFNGQQIWLGNLGEVRYLQGEYAMAAEAYRRALEISRRLGAAYFTLLWLNKLTELAIETADLRTAQEYNREALLISPRVLTRDAGIWSLLWRSRLAAEQGRAGEAEQGYREVLAAASPTEEASVIWNSRAGLARLYVAAELWDSAEEQFRLAIEGLEQTRSRLSRDEWKLSFHAQSVRLYRDYVDFLVRCGRTERALEVAESSRARLLAQKLSFDQRWGWQVPAARFRELARRLRATLMSFWLAPRGSFLWVVQPDRIVCLRLPPEPEITFLVRAVVGATEQMRDFLETENPAARRLYEVLIGPAAPLLAPNGRIVVVPDGALHELNLESLVTGEPLHYWIEDVTLAVAPSLTLLVDGPPGGTVRPDSLLLIGDPMPASPEFPRLPAVEQEIQIIRRRFTSPKQLILTGAEAHPEAYRLARPERFAMLHFAAHATASRDSPLDSAVILSPHADRFKLYAREILEVPLKAELVTVSACRGATGRLYSGEGMVGFAWAFLQAGARNVIAGLWDVHDASTAALMGQLYAELAEGHAPAVALRAAKRRLIAARTAWSKPFYWAAFQLYTRARPF